MVLVYLLRIVYSTIQLRHKVLCDSDESLDKQEDVGYETEDGMGRFEMCAFVAELVEFDYDESGYEGEESDVVQGRVDECALPLLVGCVCWLKDEGALSDEEESKGVENWMWREKWDEFMREYTGPN